MKTDYQLLDSGELKKLEQFGPYIIERPSAVAYWPKRKPALWKTKHASFTREGKGKWIFHNKLPENWEITHAGIHFKVELTDFGHLGIFPEHIVNLPPFSHDRPSVSALNLFGYTGGITCSLIQKGCTNVCHVDASKKSIAWAKENAALNHIGHDAIRWIIDDCRKFLQREIKRKSFYDIVVLDPPTYGRGAKKEVFLLEEEVNDLLLLCKQVLSSHPIMVFFTCHTLSFTPIVMKQLMEYHFGPQVKAGEMCIEAKDAMALPCGTYAVWENI